MTSVYLLLSSGDLHLLPTSSAVADSFYPKLAANAVSLMLLPPASGSMLAPPSSLAPLSRAVLEPPAAPDTTITHILDAYSAHLVYLPQTSVTLTADAETNPDSHRQICAMLGQVFPEWDTSRVAVARLTGGITNMLLQCTYAKGTPEEATVLVRTYGKGTDLIIDRDREFISHLVLNSLALAPPVHARFANGLVYGYLAGRSLSPEELACPSLYPHIAQTLGLWHRQIHGKPIEQGIQKLKEYRKRSGLLKAKSFPGSLWQLLERWIDIIPDISQVVESFLENQNLVELPLLDIRLALRAELKWLVGAVGSESFSRTVLCHCDLLSGNIILLAAEESGLGGSSKPVPVPGVLSAVGATEDNPVRFIDYEYMLPAPRGFDIANHFAEWQGFDCDRSRIPQASHANPVMREWAAAYLSTSPSLNLANMDKKVDGLITEIQGFFGTPGFYWGIWAAIQSEISIIDFDYAGYSKLRLEEYWTWKKHFKQRAGS